MCLGGGQGVDGGPHQRWICTPESVDGLLAVTIPKREEVRPRKIEITAG